jgi:hypothetical protein
MLNNQLRNFSFFILVVMEKLSGKSFCKGVEFMSSVEKETILIGLFFTLVC